MVVMVFSGTVQGADLIEKNREWYAIVRQCPVACRSFRVISP